MFQSTPGIAAGRISRKVLLAPAARRFQSTPGIAAGRIDLMTIKTFRPEAVSIHARHCCRANRSAPCPTPSACWFQSTPGIAAGRIARATNTARAARCFNPRPALLPGESNVLAANHTRALVSIHARHCCRANQVSLAEALPVHRVSIHARHCCRANQGLAKSRRDAELFQSTPGIAAGRIPA